MLNMSEYEYVVMQYRIIYSRWDTIMWDLMWSIQVNEGYGFNYQRLKYFSKNYLNQNVPFHTLQNNIPGEAFLSFLSAQTGF